MEQHAKHANVKLHAEKQLAKPKEVNVVEVVAEKSVIGKLFKKDAKLINEHLEKLTEEEINELEARINEAKE